MVDAHQHFWSYGDGSEYSWMGAGRELDVLKKDALPSDLEPLLAPAGLGRGCVAVQARQSEEETAWLLSLAETHPFIRGVVGWVDLRAEASTLRASLERFASHPSRALVGVRHVVHDEPDDAFMAQPAFRRGVGELAAFGLAYDLLLFPRHLREAAALAAALPAQTFVLDHCANPPVGAGADAAGDWAAWEADLCALAALPNVSVKLSGLVKHGPWGAIEPALFVPCLDAVVAAFGFERCMIGSDWPVALLSASYAQTIAVVTSWLAARPAHEREAIMGGNAERIYKLRPRPDR